MDFHKKTCNKPHDGFIPVNEITTQHFPPGYHDEDLLELTKAMAALTVRISVSFVSHDRPMLTPITLEPYPFHKSRGENRTTVWTGRVYDVTNYTERMDEASRTYRTCPCPTCEKVLCYDVNSYSKVMLCFTFIFHNIFIASTNI